MKKSIIFLLFFILIISIWINLYFLNSKKNDYFIENKYNNLNAKSKDNDIKLNKPLNDDNLKLSNNYLKVEWNLFSLMNDEYKKINTVDDFENFSNKYDRLSYLIWISRIQNKEIWDKFFDLSFKYMNLDNREWYDNKLNAFFLKIKNWDLIIPDIDDLDFDLQFFINTQSINNSLDNCDKYKNKNYYFSSIDFCKNNIYFYKSTKDNNLCDKITDKFKVRLCKDFLIYEESIKK